MDFFCILRVSLHDVIPSAGVCTYIYIYIYIYIVYICVCVVGGYRPICHLYINMAELTME
jgi:hypothetical protein